MKGESVHIPFSEDDTNGQEVILLGRGAMQSGRDRMRYWAAEEIDATGAGREEEAEEEKCKEMEMRSDSNGRISESRLKEGAYGGR